MHRREDSLWRLLDTIHLPDECNCNISLTTETHRQGPTSSQSPAWMAPPRPRRHDTRSVLPPPRVLTAFKARSLYDRPQQQHRVTNKAMGSAIPTGRWHRPPKSHR